MVPSEPWTDVQQQIPILADDIDELMDDELGRLERVVLDIAPGFVTYGGVGLQIEGTDIAKLAAFQRRGKDASNMPQTLRRAPQCALTISHKFLDTFGGEFVCDVEALPGKI
jgi:hypothetical protein